MFCLSGEKSVVGDFPEEPRYQAELGNEGGSQGKAFLTHTGVWQA